MTLQTITVKLPQAIYRRLEHTAAMTNQSLDNVLLQTIRGNIPPSPEDAPDEIRDELAALLSLNDGDLWAVAQSSIDPEQWQRHQHLLQKNAAGNLSEREQHELERLRAETDRHVFRRSFALAVLKWRGHTLPSLDTQADYASA
jgi:succinate dehydrogenase flavin-adding protein (antitoxin of CptAB toxin-antitoxin module)